MFLRRVDPDKLVQLRTERLWSQHELAAHAAVGVRTIGRSETGGHDIHCVTAEKIARTLEVSPDEFSTKIAAPPRVAKAS